MGRREPVSKSQALLLIASILVYAWARAVAGPLTGTQLILVLLVLEFIIQPLSTLVHECGHAVVARRVSSGPVSVIVGRGPYMSGTIGAVRVNFSLLPGRGVQFRGLCRYDPAPVSWRNRAAVSLAGPAATFLELLASVIATVAFWSSASPVLRNLLLLATIGLAISVVVNLVPSTVIPGVLANDGSRAVRALRNHSARVAITPGPTSAGATSPAPVVATRRTNQAVWIPPNGSADGRTQPQPIATTNEKDRDLARAATSIPPPPSRD